MPEPNVVKIAAAKGRPMLSWVGKRPLSEIVAYPAQKVEVFDPKNTLGADPTEVSGGGHTILR